jgi:hypothetical protein
MLVKIIPSKSIGGGGVIYLSCLASGCETLGSVNPNLSYVNIIELPA